MPEPAGPSTALGLARSAAWNVSASVASVASAVGVTAIAYRFVSDETLGVYFTVLGGQALIAMLDPVVAFGVMRTIARGTVPGESKPRETPESVQAAIDGLATISLVVLIGSAVGVGLWAGLGRPQVGVLIAILLMAAALMLQLTSAPLPATANGQGDYRASAIATVVGAAVNLGTCAVLVPPSGVLGLAAGLFLGVAVGRSTLLIWRRGHAPWLSLLPSRLSLRSARSLWHDSRSLLLMTAAAQVISWTDLLVISAWRGSGTAAQYRLGVLVPTQAVALLFRAYDVVFPVLSRGEQAQQVRATRLLTRVFGALSGAMLGGLVAVHAELLHALSGSTALRNATVPFVLFALMWAANVPAHGLSLLLIARDHQALIAPLVLMEAAANVVLTILLTPRFGAAGCAAASLVTLASCNLVVLPVLLRPERMGAVRVTLLEGLLPVVVTLFTAWGGLALAFREVQSEQARVFVAGLVTLVIAVLFSLAVGGRDGRRALHVSLAAR